MKFFSLLGPMGQRPHFFVFLGIAEILKILKVFYSYFRYPISYRGGGGGGEDHVPQMPFDLCAQALGRMKLKLFGFNC